MRPTNWQPHSESDSFLSTVDEAEFTEDNFLLLLLLPLVFVAWADGKVQPTERRLIHNIARDAEFLPGDTSAVLDRWFNDRPTAEEFGRGFRRLLHFIQSRDRATRVHAGLVEHLEELCRRVVAHRSSGSPIPTITDKEGAALDDVQALLWMAKRPSWEELDAWLDGSLDRLSSELA